MEQVNERFIDMVELLDRTGETIAGMLGVEAARITPGASAAIALGIGACLTGDNREKMERLPETSGMPNEVILQRGHRYKYDRCVLLPGGRIIEVGSESGTRRDEIERAIGPNTVALFLPAHLDGHNGTVPLRDLAAIGHERGVPTFVDAAYMNYPVEIMSSFNAQGADLVCFSAKYFGGPNAGGFIAGHADLIDAVAGVDFTRFESGDHLIFGRPFKLDRQTVVAVVVALQEWMEMDHAARFAAYARTVETIRRGIEHLTGVTATPMGFTMEETLEPEPVNCLVVRIDPGSSRAAREVEAALRAGNPAVLVHLRDDTLIVDVEMVREGDEQMIVDRLHETLSAAGPAPVAEPVAAVR
jgi:L-seryl-tRNA(Ser) seleniumtransferase